VSERGKYQSFWYIKNMNLEVKSLSFSYEKEKGGESKQYVLNNINCSFERGKMYALIGKSGSGKSTLLSLLGRLDTVDEGEVLYDNKNINDIPRIEYLRNCCTMVYQDARLFPLLTVEENITFPMELQGIGKKECHKRAMELMEKVELSSSYLKRLPSKLSGGEQQRVAIARALAVGTKVLLADEPTGNLDRITGDKITNLLLRMAQKEGYCIIVATHDVEMMNIVDQVYQIKDGNLVI
jgi:putative ABC transport system ATP-binding protein